MTTLAPIVLFAYGRPDHTERTLDALEANSLAALSDLIVYLDAPRCSADIGKCASVEAVVRRERRFRSTRIIKRAENYGLARNIIEGVTEVCNAHGNAIVMEDDLITSPQFLQFMNDGLTTYAASNQVFAISGCTYPVDLRAHCGETFFLRLPLCWGWATWADKWVAFEKDLATVPQFPRHLVKFMNFDGEHDYFRQAMDNYRGKISTWFIFWYMTLVQRGGLVLFPTRSLVENIGMDGTGENCGASSDYSGSVTLGRIRVIEANPRESAYVIEQHKRFFRRLRPSFAKRMLSRAARLSLDSWAQFRALAG